jgi:hypothetical protein
MSVTMIDRLTNQKKIIMKNARVDTVSVEIEMNSLKRQFAVKQWVLDSCY